MIWYVVFCGQKYGVYDSWGVCSEYILGFSGAASWSYFTRLEAEEAYATFLEQQNKDWSHNMLQICGLEKIGWY
jgi:viroplasmin and RNaseH domain-containing protein